MFAGLAFSRDRPDRFSDLAAARGAGGSATCATYAERYAARRAAMTARWSRRAASKIVALPAAYLSVVELDENLKNNTCVIEDLAVSSKPTNAVCSRPLGSSSAVAT